ncbi:MAG: hypothetical protein V7647_1464 [Acidobacteriota bacterium]|jgi:hypothetical protein
MRHASGLRTTAVAAIATLALVGCRGSSGGSNSTQPMNPFNSDLAFLRSHSDIVVLADPTGQARVAVAPKYQGRVMTSTTGGDAAPSFGWIGRAAIASGEKQPHMNVFGGEDRFWLGPEGGQYALYFKRGDPFDLDHWQTPEPFDWGAWDVTGQSAGQVSFQKRMSLVNYAGTRIDATVDRTVRLLTPADVATHLGTTTGDAVRMVAFESSNTVTNAGAAAWRPDSGLVSIWILGQFTPSPRTTITIPFAPGPETSLGPIVNDKYFGTVPPDRLVVRDNVLFFRADGQFRSKIGLPPSRALDVAGSYDSAAHVLTLVQYTHPAGESRYVNSMWGIQQEPYKGDAINSYNDGPVAPGKPPLGPFYELETSSPALQLPAGGRYTHVHRTIHLNGPEADLDRIARATLKVGLSDISSAFASQ